MKKKIKNPAFAKGRMKKSGATSFFEVFSIFMHSISSDNDFYYATLYVHDS